MLKIEHVSKTFNLGTINEKKALIDISLLLLVVTVLVNPL